MDEHGTAMGRCTNSMVVAPASKKRTFAKAPSNRDWVIVIETVSATGTSIKPMVIFKGTAVQTTWFPSNPPNWIYTVTQKGYTTNMIGMEWLRRIFIPETTPGAGEHRILVVDGHGSHVTVEFMLECY
jgi:hypothetical protein